MSASPQLKHRPTLHAVRPEATKRATVGFEGQVLGGRYRLVRRIATGGTASVWMATHETLHRPVAVKFVDARVAVGEDERVERFLNEAKVAASVRHKNVVDILDFGVMEHEGVVEPYMIMELLEGEALDERLYRGALSPYAIANVVRQVLSGLDAIHAAGIIHRDMKPGNVFITEDADGEFARVLDFGISQTSEEISDGTVVGTPEYMSPEQAYGDLLDRRTDLYSVGVILYEMLAGRLPFEDEDPSRVLRMVVDSTPTPLLELRPDEPKLCAIATKAMSRRATDRYQTAREMQRDIVEAMGAVDTTGRFSIPPSGRNRAVARRELETMDAEPADRGGKKADARPTASLPKLPTSSVGVWVGVGVVALLVLALIGVWSASTSSGPEVAETAAPSSPTVPPSTHVAAAPPTTTEPATLATPTEPLPATAAPTEAPEPTHAFSGSHRTGGRRGARPAPTTTSSTSTGGITRELDF
ncbi:MAG: protein kinase [Sandaracinus sp.]